MSSERSTATTDAHVRANATRDQRMRPPVGAAIEFGVASGVARRSVTATASG